MSLICAVCFCEYDAFVGDRLNGRSLRNMMTPVRPAMTTQYSEPATERCSLGCSQKKWSEFAFRALPTENEGE